MMSQFILGPSGKQRLPKMQEDIHFAPAYVQYKVTSVSLLY